VVRARELKVGDVIRFNGINWSVVATYGGHTWCKAFGFKDAFTTLEPETKVPRMKQFRDLSYGDGFYRSGDKCFKVNDKAYEFFMRANIRPDEWVVIDES
jgi:hypothetical protein